MIKETTTKSSVWMIKCLSLIYTFLWLCSFSSCFELTNSKINHQPPKGENLTALTRMDFQGSIRCQTDVGLLMTKWLLHKKQGSNVVLSPLSIQILLSMVAAGSSGPTLNQLLSFLNSESKSHLNSVASNLVSVVFSDGSVNSGPRISVANGIWIDHGLVPLNPTFQKVVDTSYKASVRLADFQNKDHVSQEMNSWTEKKTGGLIRKVITPNSISKDTLLMLANALYFKGNWNQKFDASKTKLHDFHLLDGSSVRVPFMTTKNDQSLYAFDDYKVVALPYQTGQQQNNKRQFTMHIFLPDAKDGLPALIQKLYSQSEFLHSWLPTYNNVEVGEFRIPKFKVSFDFEAAKVLKKLGLVLPFLPGGGFTDMVESKFGEKLYVAFMFHKSFVEVNEQGTEAAAVSVSTFVPFSTRIKMDFVADHPFLFMIREDFTHSILFIGHVLNPSLA